MGSLRKPIAAIMIQRSAMNSSALMRAMSALPSTARVRVNSLYSATRLLMKVRVSSKSLPSVGVLKLKARRPKVRNEGGREGRCNVEHPHLREPVGGHGYLPRR